MQADGKGDFPTIQAAIDSIPNNNNTPVIIKLAPGVYPERVQIPSGKDHVTLIGTGNDRSAVTITTSNVNHDFIKDIALSDHAEDTWVENLTLENTAGENSGQNAALYTSGKHQSFENVTIKGWQDTLALWDGTLGYFHNCEIWGSVDFIYSGGTAVFQDCTLTEIRSSGGPLTAPSTPASSPYGLVFLDCKVARGPNEGTDLTDLMRPWGANGASAFINCTMDNVSEKGWQAWDGREKTCRAVEYGSKSPDGTPIDLTKRSPWVKILTDREASSWTVETVLGGWDPTKVKSSSP